MQRPEAQAVDPLTQSVVACMLDPHRSLTLAVADWNGLLRALRRNSLLATFGERLAAAGLTDGVPAKARTQIAYARIAAESAQTAIRFEVNRMLRALRSYDGPLVLLKGAAYDFAGLPPAQGRKTGDVDVMVPRARLDEVEQTLVGRGWRSTNEDEYDQRYYREWSHEIPALLHPQRETLIDLHHTISPMMGRAHPDAAALFATTAGTSLPRLRVLAPADMVVHSTLHLFNDEVSRPLRDLLDIHLLLRHFDRAPGFWEQLCERARLHGAQRPLYYMLRTVRRVFGTGVPENVLEAASAWAPNPVLDRSMAALLRSRFSAGFVDSRQAGHRVAGRAYYVRAHWLRMPPLLLVRHLAHKSVRRVHDRMRRRADDAKEGAM